MSDFEELTRAIFAGCGGNVGPLIGVDLEIGECEVGPADAPPEGELAVLPLRVELDGEPQAALELASPLEDLAPLARRMLGDDNPDEKRELSAEDLDAVGEILNLMSGAVDQAMREHVSGDLAARPLTWWRSDDPGENAFSDGECHLAQCSLALPGGSAATVYFRFPADLQERGADAQSSQRSRSVLFLGLEDELAQTLEPILSGARMTVERRAFDDEDVAQLSAEASAIFMSSDAAAMPQLRQLRTSNATWCTPVLVCVAEPTRGQVLEAMEAGASHVVVLPPDEADLLRALTLAQAKD